MLDEILKYLKPILNKTNIGMKHLEEVLGVDWLHIIFSNFFDKLEHFIESSKEYMVSKNQSRDSYDCSALYIETKNFEKTR